MGFSTSGTTRLPVYSVADAAALAAFTAMQEGDLCLQIDTAKWYYYSTSWNDLSIAATYGASDNIGLTHNAEATLVNIPTFTKLKTITLTMPNGSGTLRVNYDMRKAGTAGEIYSRIYKNGSPFGAQNGSGSTSYINYLSLIHI